MNFKSPGSWYHWPTAPEKVILCCLPGNPHICWLTTCLPGNLAGELWLPNFVREWKQRRDKEADKLPPSFPCVSLSDRLPSVGSFLGPKTTSDSLGLNKNGAQAPKISIPDLNSLYSKYPALQISNVNSTTSRTYWFRFKRNHLCPTFAQWNIL